jgi:hypothetical protein
MRSIAIVLSILLLVVVGPVVSAMGVPTADVVQTTADVQTISLPAWGYALLGVNLLVAGVLAALPFLSK